MLKVLLKKQLAEVFRSYFYDTKRNRMRSKAAIAAYFVFFFAVMVLVLGGMFTVLSFSLCEGLAAAGMGWLYFLLMGGIAILLGAFGSVFSTYSSLYLAKDNDLLLSMPIPVRTIITARLMNVYLMGAMYAATVLIPTVIVYWIVAGAGAANVICGILFFIIITVIVLLLSCLLGWVVAKISLKLRNKSFITVIISLVFIGAYYFFYFKANDFIRDIIANAGSYGARIKGAAYGLYLFGRTGEGDWLAAAVCTAVTAILCAIVWRILSRSFLQIATASGNSVKVRYTEKTAREKSPFAALLSKEFGRFTSSANYMLNCGLGIIMIPAGGVLLLIKGREIFEAIEGAFPARPGTAAVLFCAMLFMMASMIDTAAPAVSLEGKSIWIPQSLPVSPALVLRAKMSVQLILTALPMLFASVCVAVAVKGTVLLKILICVLPLAYSFFESAFNTVIGLKMPLLNWTNETAPIKQGGAVTIALFGGWGFSILFGGLYLLFGHKIGAVPYMLAFTVLFAAVAFVQTRWLGKKGAEDFAAL